MHRQRPHRRSRQNSQCRNQSATRLQCRFTGTRDHKAYRERSKNEHLPWHRPNVDPCLRGGCQCSVRRES
jgi:hypothetical protein